MSSFGVVCLTVALFSVGAVASSQPIGCGVYQNQLGSNMTVADVNTNGHFTGGYISAVGDAKGSYDLVGTSEPSGTLSFSVSWNNRENGNSKSSTAWACYSSGGGKFDCSWYLSKGGEWNHWLAGNDQFEIAEKHHCS